jgi:hypothetical protein
MLPALSVWALAISEETFHVVYQYGIPVRFSLTALAHHPLAVHTGIGTDGYLRADNRRVCACGLSVLARRFERVLVFSRLVLPVIARMLILRRSVILDLTGYGSRFHLGMFHEICWVWGRPITHLLIRLAPGLVTGALFIAVQRRSIALGRTLRGQRASALHLIV